MKKNIVYKITFLLLLMYANSLHAQQVSIQPAGATTDNSAILDIAATDKGLLIPRMDSTARKNIVMPAEGLMVFDSTYNSFWYFDGSAWTSLNSLDQQGLWLSNDSLYLSNDPSTVVLGDYKQNLSIANDTLRLSNAPTSVDLAPYIDHLGNHTATQNIQLKDFYLGNNGENRKGIYIDTAGHISILSGGLVDTANLYVGSEILPSAIAEQQLSTNGSHLQSQWQSITVPHDGFLTHFYFYGTYNFGYSTPFRIYKGVGVTSELVYSTSVAISINGSISCPLPRILVKQGEVYTMYVDIFINNSSMRTNSHDGNPYSGGRSHHSPNHDLQFQYFMERDPSEGGYKFTDTALVIKNNYYLPITNGNPNEILVSDGAGKVNWASAGSGALVDHLGNHTMTEDLQLNGHWLNNDGGASEGLYVDATGQVGINITPAANLHVNMGGMANPGFQVHDTAITINQYSFPVIDGMANEILTTDGAGQLSWTELSDNQQLTLSSNTLSLTNGGTPISLAPYLDADNLGNHSASQSLHSGSHWIQHTSALPSTGIQLDTDNTLFLQTNLNRPAVFNMTAPSLGNYIEVNNQANTRAILGAGGTALLASGDHTAIAIGNYSSTGGLNMYTNATNRMQISAAGNVGIGRAATTNLLEVEGDASKTSAGNWLANSDARLKKNIQELNAEETLNKLLSLRGIQYEWADEQTSIKRPEGVQYGFTAQNIQEVFPALVSEDQQGYLQTAYGTHDAMTVEAIRALNQKLEQLDTQTSTIEKEIEAMLELKAQIEELSSNQ